jgi:NADH-quinone oxidoreductase subunit C
LSSADNPPGDAEGRAEEPDTAAPPDDPTTTSVEPPPDATPAEEEAPLAPEAAPDGDATGTEQSRLEDAAVEEAVAEAGTAPAEGDDGTVGPEPADPTPDEPPAPEPDPVREPLLEALRQQLGDDLVGSEIAGGDIWVRVERSAWRKAGEVCKTALGMDYFCFLSGIDWLPNPGLSAEKLWDPAAGDDAAEGDGDGASAANGYETGAAGGATRFQVFARLYSTRTKVGITLKADLDDENPTVDSWVPVYRGADWHEREAWEMYGFDFEGHPDLRHIYLPAEFEGFPLRKDFPLLSREVKPWPGLVDKEPIPGEEEEAEAGAGGES